MKFKSRTAAYSSLLLLFENVKPLVQKEGQAAFNEAIEKIRIAIENHEKKPKKLCAELEKILNSMELDTTYKQRLHNVIQDVASSNYAKQSKEDKFQNPLARRIESELPIELLTHPTKDMMQAVQHVSAEILKVIPTINKEYLDEFLTSLKFNYDEPISFGSLSEKPTVEKLIQILKKNSPDKLATIMYIHYQFSTYMLESQPILHAPHRAPVGKLAELIALVWKDAPIEDFFTKGISLTNEDGKLYRAFISDAIMYHSDLFKAGENRGRIGALGEYNKQRYHQLGLMLPNQEAFEADLPEHRSLWLPDCKGQAADLNSIYVKDEIENDAIYVSGPSGMVTLFLGQMEILANLETVALKQHYLSAVLAYMVGGGQHSIHEVLSPAQYCLDLIPGYQVQVPSKDKLAPPPNYHDFYLQQMSIDGEFASRREKAWGNYLEFLQANQQMIYSLNMYVYDLPLSSENKEVMDLLLNTDDKNRQDCLAGGDERGLLYLYGLLVTHTSELALHENYEALLRDILIKLNVDQLHTQSYADIKNPDENNDKRQQFILGLLTMDETQRRVVLYSQYKLNKKNLEKLEVSLTTNNENRQQLFQLFSQYDVLCGEIERVKNTNTILHQHFAKINLEDNKEQFIMGLLVSKPAMMDKILQYQSNRGPDNIKAIMDHMDGKNKETYQQFDGCRALKEKLNAFSEKNALQSAANKPQSYY